MDEEYKQIALDYLKRYDEAAEDGDQDRVEGLLEEVSDEDLAVLECLLIMLNNYMAED